MLLSTAKRDNIPSSAEDLLSQSGTKTFTMAGSCNLKGTFTADKAVLDVESGSCEKPSLAVIFQKLFPDIDLFEATGKVILPDQFELNKLEIAKSDKEVSIDATAKETLNFVERKMLIKDGKLNLGFTAGAHAVGIKLWKIKIEGR